MRHAKLWLATLLVGLTLATTIALPAAASNGSKKEKEREYVGSAQQVTITNQGKVQLDGVKVTAISSPNLTATSTWGSTVLTWSIKTSADTKFVRRFSGGSSLGEISVGDLVSVKGSLDSSATQLTVNASWVKDWSIQQENSTFRGTIQSIDAGAQHLVMNTERGNITVQVNGTTKVQRGDATISFSALVIGETITASGLYNNLSLTLTASKIKAKAPERRTYEGTLKSLAGTVKPTSLVFTAGAIDYTAMLAADTAVLNSWWERANLTDFVVGHSLRVFGALRPGTTTIDATVIRNTSLR